MTRLHHIVGKSWGRGAGSTLGRRGGGGGSRGTGNDAGSTIPVGVPVPVAVPVVVTVVRVQTVIAVPVVITGVPIGTGPGKASIPSVVVIGVVGVVGSGDNLRKMNVWQSQDIDKTLIHTWVPSALATRGTVEAGVLGVS